MNKQLTQTQQDLIRACNDLGVRIDVPFCVTVNGKTIEVEARLPDFGGPGGLLVLSEDDGRVNALVDAQLSFSVLDGDPGPYDLEVYKMLFSDWGWASDALPPEWLMSEAEISSSLGER